MCPHLKLSIQLPSGFSIATQYILPLHTLSEYLRSCSFALGSVENPSTMIFPASEVNWLLLHPMKYLLPYLFCELAVYNHMISSFSYIDTVHKHHSHLLPTPKVCL